MPALSPVVPGLYRLDLGTVNAYLLDAGGGPVLIDTGPPGSEAAVLAAVEALGHAPADVRAVVVTHHHADHAGSLAAVLAATGAEAWMHPLDAEEVRVGNGARPASGLLTWALSRVPLRTAAAPFAPAPVAHEVADGGALPGGLVAVHAPGHTAGHIALLWPEHGGVLVAADACTTLPVLTLSAVYEDLDVGRETLRRLGAFDVEVAVFGHGEPLLSGASRRFREAFGA